MARLPIQVEVIIFRYVKNSYEYLLLKRIPKKGGFWQPVTGGLEEGEELIDCAKREVAEEIGITQFKRIISDVHYFTMDKHYLTGEPIEKSEEYVFAIEIGPHSKIHLDNNIYVEHDDHRWCSYQEAMILLKWQDNKDALAKLKIILQKE